METRTIRRKKPGIRSKRKNSLKPAKAGFFNSKYSATERQSDRKVENEETPAISRKHLVGDRWADFDDGYDDYGHWTDWRSNLYGTIGGKFLTVLIKMNLLEPISETPYWGEAEELFRFLALAPNRLVHADWYEGPKLKQVFKKDQEVLGDGTSDC